MRKAVLFKWLLVVLAITIGGTAWCAIWYVKETQKPDRNLLPLSASEQTCTEDRDCIPHPCYKNTCVSDEQLLPSSDSLCMTPSQLLATSCACEDNICIGHITDFRYFPDDIAPSSNRHLVVERKTGEQLYANEVLVGFHDAVTPERIIAILQHEQGIIIGRIPELDVIQIQIPVDTSNAKGVHKAVQAYQSYKEVEYAEPNYVTHIENEMIE